MAWSDRDSGNRGGDFGGVDGGFAGGFGEGGPGGDGAGSRGESTGGQTGGDSESKSSNTSTGSGSTSGGDSGSTSTTSTSDARTATREAREDATARRDSFTAQSAMDAFSLAADTRPASRDLNAEAMTEALGAQRSVGGYAPSTQADRRGQTNRENVAREYSPEAQFAGADTYRKSAPNGLLAGASHLVNPAVGLGVNTMVDVRQANQYSKAQFGRDLSLREKAGIGFRSAGEGLLGAAMGTGFGMAGAKFGNAAAGPAGAAAGAMTGQIVGRNITRESFNQYGGPAGNYDLDMSPDGNAQPQRGLLQQAPQPAQQFSAGYGSTFGDYDSHIGKGFGFRTAFDAFS